MSTAVAEKKAPAPTVSPVPPDEQFWRRYSPHGEAPLSLAGSIALHTLGLGAALLLVIYIASILSKSTQSLPVEPVRMDLGGGGGSKTGSGNNKGIGSAPEDVGTPDEQPQPGAEIDAPRRPELNKVEMSKVEEKYDAVDARRINEGPEPAKAFARLDDKLRNKLKPPDGLNPGKGKGGPGSGGGDGTGTGTGSGSGTGAGKASLNNREKRMLRWHMRFTASSGPEYLAQLRGLGAFLAFPVGDGTDFKIVKNLEPGKAKLLDEDIAKISRIYWIDDNPKSVQDILTALGISMRAPKRFVAFMPPELESELFVLEKRYVTTVLRQAEFKEDKIEETIFRAARTSTGGYKAELISVTLKK